MQQAQQANMENASILTERFLHNVNDRSLKVGVVGLGYVGLPLIRAFIDAGFDTVGFDVDLTKIESLLAGKSYIKQIPDETIQDWITKGKFRPTANLAQLSEPDALLICVPTPLSTSRDPDLSYVTSTGQSIAENLREGQLIILESTTYPGTTRDVLLPILGRSGLRAGEQYFVAYSPEREDPGNLDYSASSIPKVVGGIDALSLELAENLYQAAVVETVPVSSPEVAEASKILENTYRSVNIAMVNELKLLFDEVGINIWEVIDAASTKPFGFQPFYPGPGLGGHCIPIDPFYLSWVARQHGMTTRFIELAGEINTSMPAYVVSRLTEALNARCKPVRGSGIGILGVAYKPNVDDPRESPAFKLMELLENRGADLSYNDPFIPNLPDMRSFQFGQMTSTDITPEWLVSLDAVVIVTDHECYDWTSIAHHSQLIVDTRNATKNVELGRAKIVLA
jgi:UDP-N-acetyl-D-glucosamine dehydrogenase